MKLNNDFRTKSAVAESGDDVIKKAVKLEPIKKSGKDKVKIYEELDDEDDIDLELLRLKKTESVLDYFDDGDDDDEFDDEDLSDDDYDEEYDGDDFIDGDEFDDIGDSDPED